MADTPVTSFTTFAAATDIDRDADLVPMINVDGTGATLMKKVPPIQLLAALLDRVSAETASRALTPADQWVLLTNEGAAGEVDLTLEAASAGITYLAYVHTATNLRLTAGAGDTIRLAGSVSGVAGNIVSAVVGSFVLLKAINSTEYVGLVITGSWTVT